MAKTALECGSEVKAPMVEVTTKRRGREKLYQISPRPLTDAVSWMADLGARWDDRLAALRNHVASAKRGR